MSDEVSVDVMMGCRCCLRRGPDKDLRTPYTYYGKVEIYEDMLMECFNIQIVETGGICDTCVGHLRDASAFKLEVETSQAELMACMDTASQIGVELVVKVEVMDESETSDTDPLGKPDVGENDETDVEFTLSTARGNAEVTIDEMNEELKEEQATSKPRPTSYGNERLVMVEVKEETSMGRVKTEVLSEHNDKEREPNASRTGLHTEEETKSSNKDLTCDICNKHFLKRRYLREHKHSHTDRFSCEFCHKQFAGTAHLTRHIRVHTGDKPFSCDQCDKKFAQHEQLKKHACVHADSKNIREKLFTCDICNKRLARATNLRNHKRLHTGEKPFICNTCGKQFTQKTNLIQHTLIHTDKQPYSCEKCKKTFKHYSSFARHKLTHTGVKFYTCDLCSTQFKHKRSLIPHFRRHNREKKSIN